MGTNIYTGSSKGAFGTEGSSDSNWSLGHVPTSSENAVIGANLIVVSTSDEDVGSISLWLIPLTQVHLYVVGAGLTGSFARIVTLDDVPIASGLVVDGEPEQCFE